MDTADRLLYTEGITRTGVQRILDEADVARGTLYGNFEGKDDLVEAYLAKRHRDTMSAITEQIGQQTSTTAVFDAFLTVAERRSQAPGFRGCAFALAVAEMPEEDSAARRWAARHKAALKDRLLETLPGHEHADELAEQLMVIYDGALLSTALRPGSGSFVAARLAGRAVLGVREVS